MTEMDDYLIYTCVTGSRAYGLAHADSDTDIRGIYLPPARLHWSLRGVPESVQDRQQPDTRYWEIGKFLRLALAANPTILECLWAPTFRSITPMGLRLLEQRHIFLSRRLSVTYQGYARAQLAKLREAPAGPTWKHAMHMIRLLLAGIAACRTGELLVDMGEYREDLLAIRRGEVHINDVIARSHRLEQEMDDALRGSPLPEAPDEEAANAYLLFARRSMVVER